MAKTTFRVITDPGQWRGVGLSNGAVNPSSDFSDVNPPWRLKAGESIYDNMPTGATVVNASSYTTSRDMYTVLNVMDKITSPSGPIYIQLDAGAYTVFSFQNYGTPTNPSWLGYANSNRKILGLIGAGFDPVTKEFLTRITVDGGMVANSPDNARDAVLGATSATGLNGCTALYFSNTGTSVPMFFSGISFDGTLQGPYGVYTTAAQAAFRRNNGATSPLAWNGISMWRANPGSRFQFCRFRGFGFALNSAPPFECGSINTNYCSLVTHAVEVDGRIAGSVDPNRPRAAGGWMYNKELNVLMSRSWIHHTRRSGMATNTNTTGASNLAETYNFLDFQATSIADIEADDIWPSDASTLPGGFNSWNVESVGGKFFITNGYANSVHSHVNWALPGATGGSPSIVPDHLILKVNGFKTDDSLFNGCLRVSTPRNPNSTGDSPVWTMINANQTTACALMFEIRQIKDGPQLTPVKASLFNAGTMGPSTHYVLRSF